MRFGPRRGGMLPWLMVSLFILCCTWIPAWSSASGVSASQTSRELALVEIMQRFRAELGEADDMRAQNLQDELRKSEAESDSSLTALALGVHYLSTDNRLALEYLTKAEKICREQDQLMPMVRFYVADARLRAGAFEEASAVAESLLLSDAGDSWKRGAYGIVIESLYRSNKLERMLKFYQEYSRRYTLGRREERLTRLAVEAYEKRGEINRATGLLTELAENYPVTDNARWALRKLIDWSCVQGQEQKPRYVFSRRLLLQMSRNLVLDSGLKEFILSVITAPMEVSPGQVRLLTASERADLLFRARLYDEAYTETLQIYATEKWNRIWLHSVARESERFPLILFELGRINLRRGDMLQASRYFSEFIADFPKHKQLAKAHEYLGDALKYLAMPGLATEQYAIAGEMQKDKIVRFEQFWTSYRSGNNANALRLLDTPGYVVPRRGDPDVLVTYWRGRILEKLGRKQEANALFTKILEDEAEGYYASLVAARYPSLLPEKPASKTAMAAKLLARSESIPATASDLRVVDQLARVGMRNAASIQLNDMKWASLNRFESFSEANNIAKTLEDYQTARRIRSVGFSSLRNIPSKWAEFLHHQSANTDEWRIYYPLAFERIFSSITDRMKLDKLFVLSIMRAESWYAKDARSQVGARGLMQIMPYTAIKLARWINDAAFDIEELERPEVNISYGSYYLDKLVRYYDGNQFLAAAAYNGGPLIVNRWLKACQGCSTDEFVESIPFRETRRYVREVMKNYAQYARLYRNQATFADLPSLPGPRLEDSGVF